MRTLQSELIKNGLSTKKKANETTNRLSINERLSKREIEELMGIRRDIYERRGGAIRRK